MAPGELGAFYQETTAATFILMLCTYEDLGIDISWLAKRWHAFEDFGDFFLHSANTGRES
jgi:hypothetical protein